MALSLSLALSAAALIATVALAHPAQADALLFQTATTDPNAVAEDNTFVLQGDGTTANSLFFGADFSVTGRTSISSIGAAFADTATTSSGGPIFGAIVSVDPTTGLPTSLVENLANTALAFALFTPTTDGDNTVSLSLVLNPGTYGVVFGSGLFGATTGVAGLLAGEDTVGSPSIFEYDFGPAGPATENDVRLLVNTVPEPTSLALLASGLVLAGAARRRRRA